jgi:outer membrane protein assembly factor BamB
VRAAVVAALATVACAKPVFRLSSDDNNRNALATALASRQLAAGPVNASHQPRMFAVLAGSSPGKTIVCYDLAAGKLVWKADADVQSRIVVGSDFIALLEGKQLVGRDQATGAVRWRANLPGTFVGAAADRERAYAAARDGNRAWLYGFDGGSGKELWKDDAEGKLGAPAAHGGVVYAPYLDQWLGLIDGRTGAMLTRIRGIDEQIQMLRVTSDVAYYGTKASVFRLDARSASGTRDGAAYGTVPIPKEIDNTTYGRDVYDPIQIQYTAADRSRVLFATEATDSGPLKLAGDGYAIHYFRYLFGFGAGGELRWAYNHPRVELVAAEHTGAAIIAVSSAGEVVALDAKTGALKARLALGVPGVVLGATFDADGWAPAALDEPVATVASLVAISRDHDARFDRVKALAVRELAKLQGPEVTKELLGVLADKRAPQKLKDDVADLLVARKDPASLPVLAAQLAVKTDYIAKTEPESLGPVAKAIAGLDGVALDAKLVATALAALQSHLDAPTTATSELIQVIDAMAAIGGGAERPALASHLLLYHGDDEVGGDGGWGKAIAIALYVKGGPGERALLREIAADPRTKPALVTAIKDVLRE